MVFDVAVVGGGLVGASLVRALDQAGFNCALIESVVPAAPRPDEWDSRVYAVSPAAQQFLASIGAWQELDHRRTAPVSEMKVHGDRASQLRFSAYECGVDRLATIVESGSLQQALWRSLPTHRRLRVMCPARPASLTIHADRVEVGLDAAAGVEARLVVGADGANSWVRDAAGIEARRSAAAQAAVVCNFSCERAHGGVAFQWFRADGVLAWLPLPGERMSMVWSTTPEHAAALADLDDEGLGKAVAQAGTDALGSLQPLGPARTFPIAPLHVRSRVRERIALVGDAAHVIHPLAGQGVNLGFGDARALSSLLAPGADPGRLPRLRRFERERAEDILALRLATRGLQRLFGAPGAASAAARNHGLNLTNRMPVLKNLLARRAMRSG
jgi:ubiquinone biosynthesis UbiH/UbiF/VisC/COQ6 family hydroxylase